ncbi:MULTISPECIES: hypothetical protein [unclassified Blastococcus]
MVTGNAGDVNWFTAVAWPAVALWGLRRRRLIRRALVRNGGADLPA